MFGHSKRQPADPQTPELPVCEGDWASDGIAQFRDRLGEQTMSRASEDDLDTLLATMPLTPRNTANLVLLYATSITETLRATRALEIAT